MTVEPMQTTVLIEPDGLAVPVGSRIAYLFRGERERARFAPFIAAGLAELDKCMIVTDDEGRRLFREAITALGVDTDRYERQGALVIITDELSVEVIEPTARPLLEDARRRFRFMRCVNDASWMAGRGWTARQFLRFEMKGHLLTQNQPCTIICQYDTDRVESNRLEQILAAHRYTVRVGSPEVERVEARIPRIEVNPDRRPLSQIIFDSMDEQLRVLTQLQRLSLKLTASLALDPTLDAIIDEAVTICRANRAAISCISDAGGLKILRHRGLSDDYIARRVINRLDPAVAAIIQTREPIIIEDIESVRNISPNYPAWKIEGIRSIVTLPLISEGEVFGVIGAGSDAVSHYTQTELDAMAILAAQASAAIINARLFEQLREANRAKDEFLATLSHELRTPLTPILGWMHLLRPLTDMDPLLAQGLEAIERNAGQQAGLINDLLDLTRIISGKIDIARAPVDLNLLVETAVDHIRPQVAGRDLAISLDLPATPIICDVDPVRMRQVVANLLNNAVKFTAEGGQVRVSIRRGGEAPADPRQTGVVIEVADTGIGIDPEFLPRVFERFAQAHGGINRRFGGLGLGLAISRAIVELHGGQITASSEGLGCGSRFTVRLPPDNGHGAAVRKQEGLTYQATAEEKSGLAGLRVLVIEDSRDTVDMLRLWLNEFGCDVEIATEAVNGLSLASKLRPDIIISDIGMPQIDGYELIRKLRGTPGLEQVPAIALTGYAREEDRELALAAGYNAHIAKPPEMRRLLYLIRELMNR